MYNILIDKMKVVNSSPVEYYFYFDESWKSVNELIGKKFHFIGQEMYFVFVVKNEKIL